VCAACSAHILGLYFFGSKTHIGTKAALKMLVKLAAEKKDFGRKKFESKEVLSFNSSRLKVNY
jgi:hypothetical protein